MVTRFCQAVHTAPGGFPALLDTSISRMSDAALHPRGDTQKAAANRALQDTLWGDARLIEPRADKGDGGN